MLDLRQYYFNSYMAISSEIKVENLPVATKYKIDKSRESREKTVPVQHD